MQLFLISGLSGSGKSVALNVLEDSGYYCVDNLPAELLHVLTNNLKLAGVQKVAVSVDVRSGNSVVLLPQYIEKLKQQDIDVHLLFLDANNETLVKRFSETRRLHPLSDGVKTLPESVTLERELLAEIASIGHHIDTSDLNANALRAWIKQFIALDRARLTLLFESFAFKNGLPLDADLVFDVRCLPNPHYDPVLRPYTGRDKPVIDFLDGTPLAQKMYTDIRNFIENWLPSFIADNRSYLTVAIGCTGGQHRSVYFAEKLAQHFKSQQQVLLRHRELTQQA
ncbi:RNase adapter RapZ [Sideroxydans sp. CL21]|uniref:RNase adapter RapZ n=1 Tax=Sideroxydans sp. CL21 TaxID=2600596 RepID=UPI0012AA3098|nr:RNase adapter RapZ [Sideroxydans sp. CL21]VVC82488.1 RNase adapter protein RapZ [Sideroxydans sp. CL21]